MASPRAAFLAAAGLLAARGAAAAPPTHPVSEALRVEPNRCFDAASLAPVLVRWLQRDAIDARLGVEIAGEPGSTEGLVLRVRREGHVAGERRFPRLAGPCEEVRAAVGLVAAIAVDATVLESLGVAPAPVVTPPPPPPTPWPGVSASFDALVLFGVLPSAVGALAPGLRLHPVPPVELRLSGLISAAGTLALDGRSVDVALLAGRADACAAYAENIVRVRACAGVAAGRFQVTTTDALGPTSRISISSSAPWAAALARADLRLSMSPWLGLVFGADAIVPFTRPTFAVVTTAGAPVASSGVPVFGAAVSLGPEITFR